MDSNAGQRKLSRRARATIGGHHGATAPRTFKQKKLEREQFIARNGYDEDSRSWAVGKRVARAIKKRLKTREDRAVRREEF